MNMVHVSNNDTCPFFSLILSIQAGAGAGDCSCLCFLQVNEDLKGVLNNKSGFRVTAWKSYGQTEGLILYTCEKCIGILHFLLFS